MALSTIGTNSIAGDAVTVAKATGFGKILGVQDNVLSSVLITPLEHMLMFYQPHIHQVLHLVIYM